MDLGFGGEITDLYQRYRRGYPPAMIDSIVEYLTLTRDDLVVDLGCGTGQLTLPMAARTRAAVGVDPESDMLSRARRAAQENGVRNVAWMLGDDTGVATLSSLWRPGEVGAVVIGQALHWMDHGPLFHRLRDIVRPGGGVAVLTNGVPLWLQDTDWSRALRDFLEDWLNQTLRDDCGSDPATREGYRHALDGAGFDVIETTVDYRAELSFDQLLGGVYSSFPAHLLPVRDKRTEFSERLGAAVRPHLPYVEDVRVVGQLGRVPTR